MTNRTPEGYRFLEHTSDALIEAWGPGLESAFAQAARGFYETMLNLRNVEPKIEEQVNAEGHDEKELLYDWLEALLLKFDIDGMVYSEFHINPISDETRPIRLQAKLKGEKYVPQKHGAKVEIKGVTYHLMKIQRRQNQSKVQFLLDL
jgi:SHS2 domain-containing protein